VTNPRCALIVDDAKGALGALALRLIRLGIDSYYAKDLDEARLLAEQEAARIRVLVIAPGIGAREVSRLLTRLGAPASGRPCSAVVIGPAPDEAARESLREAGVGWALWEPFEESALRMVLSSSMGPPAHGEHVRRHPRLPTTLLGRAFKGSSAGTAWFAASRARAPSSRCRTRSSRARRSRSRSTSGASRS
jgi:hypothetical protein